MITIEVSEIETALAAFQTEEQSAADPAAQTITPGGRRR
jgi:hypothetical protein